MTVDHLRTNEPCGPGSSSAYLPFVFFWPKTVLILGQKVGARTPRASKRRSKSRYKNWRHSKTYVGGMTWQCKRKHNFVVAVHCCWTSCTKDQYVHSLCGAASAHFLPYPTLKLSCQPSIRSPAGTHDLPKSWPIAGHRYGVEALLSQVITSMHLAPIIDSSPLSLPRSDGKRDLLLCLNSCPKSYFQSFHSATWI